MRSLLAAILLALTLPLSAHAASMTAATVCPSDPRCPNATGWLFDYKVSTLDANGAAVDGFTHVLVKPTTIIGMKKVACDPANVEIACRNVKRAKQKGDKGKPAVTDPGVKMVPVYATTQAEAQAWADKQVGGKEGRWKTLKPRKK